MAMFWLVTFSAWIWIAIVGIDTHPLLGRLTAIVCAFYALVDLALNVKEIRKQ